MNAHELRDLVATSLGEHLAACPGGVLLTGIETVRPGNTYVMGLNPGGDPADITRPILECLAGQSGTSAWTHDCWQPRCSGGDCAHMEASGLVRESALVRHQRHMIALASSVFSTPAQLCATNAIFARSRSAAKLKRQTGCNVSQWWNACWPVHQALLEIVRPQMIVTLGYGERSSAFGMLRRRSIKPTVTRKLTDEGRRGGWVYEASLPLRGNAILKTHVVGVPHPSWYAPGPILAETLSQVASGVMSL